MHAKPILSVGIDVGTTTTHLTVSRLHLQNISRLSQPSRLVIGRREIVYQGDVHCTPLTVDNCIDVPAVAAILLNEYCAAGITAADISTGAVIVTGESAKKRNAAKLGEELRELAGGFVVASAGPNLESILAARGSGAAAASQETGKTIGNIDIGGGTTNIAVYTSGVLAATGCLSIGGRFLQLSEQLELLSLSACGKLLWQAAVGSVAGPGTRLDDATISQVCAYAAELILDVIDGTADSLPSQLSVSAYQPPANLSVDQWWFSGGVAETMSIAPALRQTRLLPAAGERPLTQRPAPALRTRYGDVGPWLGEALVRLLAKRDLQFHVPNQPIRATVIGAGMHSLQLSGSTVSVEVSALPISNMPVVQPFKRGLPAVDNQLDKAVIETIRAALKQQDLNWQATAVALFIPELPDLTYIEVNAWAGALSVAFTKLKGRAPLVIVCARDVGAALGLAIKKQSQGECLVLDGISDACGDFIDIGKPLANQQAIPVVLKDLIFS